MSQAITVEKGVEMAVRRPGKSHLLLAKTLANMMNGEGWIDRTMKKKFCALFISNYIDHAVEREVNPDILERVKAISFPRALRMLKRNPESGLKVLVVLVMQELKNRQMLNETEQCEFYEEIFGNFFPEINLPSIKKR
jgi:hypothetical protein